MDKILYNETELEFIVSKVAFNILIIYCITLIFIFLNIITIGIVLFVRYGWFDCCLKSKKISEERVAKFKAIKKLRSENNKNEPSKAARIEYFNDAQQKLLLS